MNAGRQRCAVAAVIIRLDSVRAATARGVEVDGDERRAALRICDRDALPERNEDVAVACHHHAVAAFLEHVPQPLGDVERQLLLTDALARHSTTIEAAV